MAVRKYVDVRFYLDPEVTTEQIKEYLGSDKIERLDIKVTAWKPLQWGINDPEDAPEKEETE